MRARFATGKDIISAPFVRKKEQNQWSIRVCTSSTLLGDKYKTRTFTDYSYYKNETVYLMTINGLNGTTIDFTQANTYANLDGDELDVYVGLEAEKLSREIEKVFKNPDEATGDDGGLLSMHINSEQERIGADFGKYYEEWYKGEMMRGMAGWNKPIANGAPSIAVSINIGAQIAGYCLAGTAGAAIGQFAAAALTTGLDMADGQLTWKQGGAQIGSGLVTKGSGIFAPVVSGALQGIDYEDGGGVGWDNDMFKDGLRSGVKEMGVRAVVGNIPGLSDVAASWVDTDGGWGDWGFDNGNWGDHLISGFGGAIGAAGLPGQSGQLITEIIRSSAYNIGGGNSFEDHEGIDEGMFNWNLFSPKASDIGALLPQMAGYAMNGIPAGKGEGSQPGDAPAPDPMTADPLQQADEYLGGLWYGNRSWSDNISNIFGRIAGSITAPFESINEIYNNGGISGLMSAYAGKIGSDVMNSLKSWSVTSLLATAGSVVMDGLQSFGKWFMGLFEDESVDIPKDGLEYSAEDKIKIAKMLNDKEFRELQESLKKEGKRIKTADDPELREQAMKEYQDAAKGIKKNSNGIWEMEIGGAKIEFTNGAETTAANNGMTMSQYAGCLDAGMIYMINDMVRDLDVKSITVSATYYNDPKAPAGHDKGLSIDITQMTFNDPKMESIFFDNRTTEVGESNSAAIVFAWLINRSEVMDVYNPWQLLRGSADKWKPFPNEWISGNTKLTEFKRMKQHNNHMHIRLRELWRK